MSRETKAKRVQRLRHEIKELKAALLDMRIPVPAACQAGRAGGQAVKGHGKASRPAGAVLLTTFADEAVIIRRALRVVRALRSEACGLRQQSTQQDRRLGAVADRLGDLRRQITEMGQVMKGACRRSRIRPWLRSDWRR